MPLWSNRSGPSSSLGRGRNTAAKWGSRFHHAMGGFQRWAHKKSKQVSHVLDKYGERAEHMARGAYSAYRTGRQIWDGGEWSKLVHSGRDAISQTRQAFGPGGGDIHKRLGRMKQGRDTMMRHISSGGIGGKLARRMRKSYETGQGDARYTKMGQHHLKTGSAHLAHMNKYSIGNQPGATRSPPVLRKHYQASGMRNPYI